MTAGRRILVIDSDRKMADILRMVFSEHGFTVEVAYDGNMGYRYISVGGWDLVTLDVDPAGMNGYDLCKAVHYRDPRIPVIMLSSGSSLSEKVAGYNAGADDYMIKPFDLRELLLKIHAVLRRTSGHAVPVGYILRAADLEMNLYSMEVTRAGQKVVLTTKEFQLLEYLVRRQNSLVSRADLSVDVWDMDIDSDANVIDVYMSHIRRKIDKGFDQKLIRTYPGMGYTLQSDVFKAVV